LLLLEFLPLPPADSSSSIVTRLLSNVISCTCTRTQRSDNGRLSPHERYSHIIYVIIMVIIYIYVRIRIKRPRGCPRRYTFYNGGRLAEKNPVYTFGVRNRMIYIPRSWRRKHNPTTNTLVRKLRCPGTYRNRKTAICFNMFIVTEFWRLATSPRDRRLDRCTFVIAVPVSEKAIRLAGRRLLLSAHRHRRIARGTRLFYFTCTDRRRRRQ